MTYMRIRSPRGFERGNRRERHITDPHSRAPPSSQLTQESLRSDYCTPAVNKELLGPPIGLPRVDVQSLDFVLIQSSRNYEQVQRLLENLDPGESEALALSLSGVAVLIGESAGRAMAKQLGLLPIGVLGILVRGKQRGLIEKIEPLIDDSSANLDSSFPCIAR